MVAGEGHHAVTGGSLARTTAVGMLYLRTLGGLSLEQDASPAASAAGRRARLAILAVLAAAGDRGISRDRLFALLWPESDTSRARGALKQALYTLRRELRTPRLTIGTQELRLDPELITSDVQEFETAIANRELERAVQLYRGPFLDGLFLKEAPAFERWMEGERSRLQRQYLDALEQLARGAEASGDLQQSLSWWRRLASGDPFNSRVTLGLMTALAAAGDRAGAIQYARLHELLLREELELEPDDSVVALAERLRTTPKQLAVIKQENISAEEGAYPRAPAPVPVEPPQAVAPPTRPRRWTGHWRGAALTLSAAAVVAAAVWLSARNVRAARTDDAVIAVFPFRVTGSSRNVYLREGIVDLLSRNLDGAGELRAIDPHVLLRVVRQDSTAADDPTRARAVARALGAGEYVLGEVVDTPNGLRISASLYDEKNGVAVLSAGVVEGAPEQTLPLVDRLTEQLLSGRARGPTRRLTSTASLTTGSLAALKAYLEGDARFVRAQYALALEAYQRAVRYDTSFALAYYRLSNAADWASRQELVLPAARLAVRFSDRLSEHDRLLVQAHLDSREGDIEAADRRYRRIVHAYPDDVEAWYQLGELLFHHNPIRGRSFMEAWEPFSRVIAFEPDNHDVMVHLARIAARRGNPVEVDTVMRRALRIASPTEVIELRALRAFVRRDSAEQERLTRELSGADVTQLYTLVWRVATYAGDIRGAERLARTALDEGQSEGMQVLAHSLLAQLELSLGRWESARGELDRLAALGGTAPMEALVHRAHGLLLPFFPWQNAARDTAVISLDSLARALISSGDTLVALGRYHECLAALLRSESMAKPDADVSRRLIRNRDPDAVKASMQGCVAEVRGVAAYVRGEPAEALAQLQSGHAERPEERPHEALDRFLIAESLAALGRFDDALSWYESIADIGVAELPYRAPAEERLAQIYGRRGDRQTAAMHYHRFVDLWRECEPAIRPRVRAAMDSLQAWRR